MKKSVNALAIKPERLEFGKKDLVLWEKDAERIHRIPYEEMVYVFLEEQDEITGNVIAWEIQDIEKDMIGDLVIWDQNRQKIRIDLSGQKESAGSIFIRLSKYIPFAFLGYSPWIEIEQDGDFQRMLKMIKLYKELNEQMI